MSENRLFSEQPDSQGCELGLRKKRERYKFESRRGGAITAQGETLGYGNTSKVER